MAVTSPMFWRTRIARSSSMACSGCAAGRRCGVDIERACDDVRLGELLALEFTHDAAVIHDGNPVAAADQLVIISRIEQDGGALVGEFAHQPIELLLGAD